MADAATEEALLDHRLREGAPKRTATFIMRLSLDVRRQLLPWTTVQASIAVIISESLSATNILMNLLAIAFITEVWARA